MNFEDSKTSDTSHSKTPYRLLVNISDKSDLKKSDKYVALSNLSRHFKWTNMKKSYKNNKFKVSAPTWNETFEWIIFCIRYSRLI